MKRPKREQSISCKIASSSNPKKGANKAEISVRALAYIVAGHELHHRKMLVEKYGC